MIREAAIERMIKISNLSYESSKRFLVNAILRGKPYEQFSGRERQYLHRKIHDGNPYRKALAYNGYCIIAENNSCLYVEELPYWFGKKKYYDGKDRIRRVKVYMRSYKPYDNERYYA